MNRTITELKESEEYKQYLEKAMTYYESERRKNYSAQRIENHIEDYKSSMEAGLEILDKHGNELLRSISELRRERIKKARDEDVLDFV